MVRTAVPSDAPHVAAVVTAVRDAGRQGAALRPDPRPVAVAPVPDDDVAAAVAASLRRPDVVVLVAEVEQVPVGVLVLRRGEVLPLSPHALAHVDQLAVVPAERRRGIGRALLAAAARTADADGAERIVVSAPPDGREAHRFLARLGFAPLLVQRSASVTALRRSLHGPSARERAGGEDPRREAVERLLSRRRRERGLPSAV